MLSLLHIENIAIIEKIDISLTRGFNVFSGETGAGKSIVIGAISAVLGGRAGRDLIRSGCSSAFISAVFSDISQDVLKTVSDMGYEIDDDDTIILQREIFADGKNICKVNMRPATVSVLKAIGCELVNIHGQHDGQTLLDEKNHIRYLDKYAQCEDALSDYKEKYALLRNIEKKIAELKIDDSAKMRRIETLRYEIDEITSAALIDGEEEELLERRALLQNAGRIMDAIETANFLLNGDENSSGAVDLLTQAGKALSSASGVTSELTALYEKAEQARYMLSDFAFELTEFRGRFDFSPGELNDIESRLDVISKLKRKYGSSISDILKYLGGISDELSEIEMSDEILDELSKKLETAMENAKTAAGHLSAIRRKKGEELEKKISGELADLNMPGAKFCVSFKECALRADGCDEVIFLISANAGEAPKALEKIASGGELSRIMLAIKNIFSQIDDVESLIFDEIDAGISGRAAQKVAEKIFSVSIGKQVICITHLPQIAAMGDSHFLISKSEKNEKTFTSVTLLNEQDRPYEIARMTGGKNITDLTVKSATEMIQSADDYKRITKGDSLI